MNGAVSTRHAARQRGSLRRKNLRKKAKVNDVDAAVGRLFSFTIDADTARIVKIEALDATGDRRELSEEEKADLIRGSDNRLEDALECAFEAGIACVLGEESAEERPQETDEDAELRHLMLAQLIEHSAAGALMRHEVLNRAILEALIRDSIQTPSAARPQETAAGTPAAHTALARSNRRH